MVIEDDRKPYQDLNGAHPQSTVFIIGAGPQLARISKSERRQLERCITIGVNHTFYMVQPTYFLSAYIGHIMLARLRVPKAITIHMRPIYAPPLVPSVLSLKRKIFEPSHGLPSEFTAPEPTLYTKFNVVLGATHLAFILGAKRIVYIGVEQRNLLHFYHFDEVVRQQILKDLTILKDVPNLNIDHPYASYERMNTMINRRVTECYRPFNKLSHEQIFAQYFNLLYAHGIEIYATTSASVIADAGATVVSLSKLLAEENCLDTID